MAPTLNGLTTARVSRVLLIGADDFGRVDLVDAMTTSGRFVVVGEASVVAEAVVLARDLRPDVVIIDLDLPVVAGTDLITQLRTTSAEMRIVLSCHGVSNDNGAVRRVERGRLEVDRLVRLVDDFDSATAESVSIELPDDVASVARARSFVDQWCRAWGAPQLVETASLVVSELVTNAIAHGGGIRQVRLQLDESALRVEVVDHGLGSPEIVRTSVIDERGRGLHIVSMASRVWGVEDSEGDSKTIWAEIPRH